MELLGLLFGALVGFASGVAVCLASQSKRNADARQCEVELRHQIGVLADDRYRLGKTVAHLENENADLRGDRAKLGTQLKVQVGETNRLSDENAEFRRGQLEIDEQNQRLTDENRGLSGRNAQLLALLEHRTPKRGANGRFVAK